MRALRRYIVVRIVTCLLLTWAAADLFVPALCSSEEVSQASGDSPSPQDRDDCFCCCSHVETVTVAVNLSEGDPVVIKTERVDDLPSGPPSTVYHPPLFS